MSTNKTRFAKIEITNNDNKEQPWLFLKSPVGKMPGPVIGMMVMSEKAARGEIPFDRELIDKLAWLDLVYTGESSFGYCSGYLDYCDKFIADFNENY